MHTLNAQEPTNSSCAYASRSTQDADRGVSVVGGADDNTEDARRAQGDAARLPEERQRAMAERDVALVHGLPCEDVCQMLAIDAHVRPRTRRRVLGSGRHSQMVPIKTWPTTLTAKIGCESITNVAAYRMKLPQRLHGGCATESEARELERWRPCPTVACLLVVRPISGGGACAPEMAASSARRAARVRRSFSQHAAASSRASSSSELARLRRGDHRPSVQHL
jgi:hypothetical protein